MQKGINNIKKTLKVYLNSTGVYKMISVNNEILYIGKAKNLCKRVKSYTSPLRLNNRLQKMISLIDKVEYITTEDETMALLLEANLIKKLSLNLIFYSKMIKLIPILNLVLVINGLKLESIEEKKILTTAILVHLPQLIM